MSCCICLSEITRIKTIECKHSFCMRCINIWTNKQLHKFAKPTCPCCRKTIVVKDCRDIVVRKRKLSKKKISKENKIKTIYNIMIYSLSTRDRYKLLEMGINKIKKGLCLYLMKTNIDVDNMSEKQWYTFMKLQILKHKE